MILTIRSDKPIAEIGLFMKGQQLASQNWEAHLKLAESIHKAIKDMLVKQDIKLSDIDGIVVYRGPGSFTGLRIGTSVANALAAALRVPITGEIGSEWQAAGIRRLRNGENDQIVVPEYGAPVHITQQKK